MSRELKFRVWDNVDYMSKPFTLHDLMVKKIEFTGDCPVMQYTGLKDKKGKEIYEGDIIRVFCGALMCPYINISIEWSDRNLEYMTNAKMAGLWETLSICHYDSDHDIEVIGNIYENPELLNSEQNVQASVATEDDSSNAGEATK